MTRDVIQNQTGGKVTLIQEELGQVGVEDDPDYEELQLAQSSALKDKDDKKDGDDKNDGDDKKDGEDDDSDDDDKSDDKKDKKKKAKEEEKKAYKKYKKKCTKKCKQKAKAKAANKKDKKVKVSTKAKNSGKSGVKEMVIREANGRKPKKVTVSKDAKQKAESKAKIAMGKTEIIDQPVNSIKDVIEALKKSTEEVINKNEEFAKKEIDKIVDIKKAIKAKEEAATKQAEIDFMSGNSSKATQTALSKPLAKDKKPQIKQDDGNPANQPVPANDGGQQQQEPPQPQQQVQMQTVEKPVTSGQPTKPASIIQK